MRTDGRRIDKATYMAKLIVAFRSCANAPKNVDHLRNQPQMFDVCHADELCRVRCKVERRFLINGILVSLHSELLVTEGQMGGAWGPSNKSDTFEIGAHLERKVIPSSLFKGLNSIIVRCNV